MLGVLAALAGLVAIVWRGRREVYVSQNALARAVARERGERERREGPCR